MQRITTALSVDEFFEQREKDEFHGHLLRLVNAWRADGYDDPFILELLHGFDDQLSGHWENAPRH
ncbi:MULTISPECIES: hypothetical protein [unclassified Sulfitobacter]|uniref:hypothetical protein n=1 Tax=unclassified Sulfitobacter TaxID=196795 RepID=UPI003746B122